MKPGLIFLHALLSSLFLNGQTDTITSEVKKIEILKANQWYLKNQLDLQGYNFSNTALNEELYTAAMLKKKGSQKGTAGGVVLGLGVLAITTMNSVGNSAGEDIFSGNQSLAVATLLIGIGAPITSIWLLSKSGKLKKESRKHIQIAKEMYGG